MVPLNGNMQVDTSEGSKAVDMQMSLRSRILNRFDSLAEQMSPGQEPSPSSILRGDRSLNARAPRASRWSNAKACLARLGSQDRGSGPAPMREESGGRSEGRSEPGCSEPSPGSERGGGGLLREDAGWTQRPSPLARQLAALKVVGASPVLASSKSARRRRAGGKAGGYLKSALSPSPRRKSPHSRASPSKYARWGGALASLRQQQAAAADPGDALEQHQQSFAFGNPTTEATSSRRSSPRIRGSPSPAKASPALGDSLDEFMKV